MSRYVQYKIDYEQMLALEQKMANYAGDVEKAVNNVIHERGAKLIIMNIIGFMPRSKGPGPHAKDSKRSMRSVPHNLGVLITEGPVRIFGIPRDGNRTKKPSCARVHDRGIS